MWGAVFSVILVGCASQRMNMFSVSPVETLVPDSDSRVRVDATISIPEKSLPKRSRLIVRPRLVQADSVVAECTPMVLDAPIYAKKTKRREKLSNYVDSLAEYAKTVNNKRELSFPYRASIIVPEHFDGGRIVASASTSGCGQCNAFDTVDMAYIANISTLIKPHESLQLNWMAPEFVIRPKIVKGKGEARLQFVINHYDINLTLGNNRHEMEAMLATLGNIVSDSLKTLNSLDIYGMASADGPYDFNMILAKNRATAAKQWLISRLHMSTGQAALITTGSHPEGWGPVLAAMRADGYRDTLAVTAILDRYDAENDDAAEYRIRRLACWPDIRDKYLQKDRKVEYEYTYTIRSFTTDDELLAMYDKRPDVFNEEELLRVTTLMKDTHEKMRVYRTILHYFPQSQTSANNLAVLLLREGRTDEAESVLDSLEEFSPEMLNTKAAIYVYRNDYERAIELFETRTEQPEARYNLGLLMAAMRKLDRAYELMKGYEDTNTAIVALSVGRNDAAARIMVRCDDRTPRAEYVRAIIAARSGDSDALFQHLGSAVADASLRRRAVTEADFIPYASLAEFIELTNHE